MESFQEVCSISVMSRPDGAAVLADGDSESARDGGDSADDDSRLDANAKGPPKS